MYLGLLGYLALQPYFLFYTIMKIEMKDSTIVITLDSAASVSKVWIDTLDNYENMYSAEDDKHSYVVNSPSVSGTTVQINSETLSPELDTSAFLVTINGSTGFYYDEKELYYKEIDLLTNFCSTCLDKHQKERMVLFMTKYHLFQYAIANNLLEDQVNYYIDLARMLGIDFKYNAKLNTLYCGRCNKVIKCCNGYCALC